MVKQLLALFLIGYSGYALANEKTPITLEHIEAIESTAPTYSLTITLKAEKTVTYPWALGFYSPRTFDQFNETGQAPINPDLHLQICEADANHCAPLTYTKDKKTYVSSGSITILATANQYPLQANKIYKIEISNSNQGAPHNYSAMPQSFFWIANDKTIANLKTSPELYLFNPDKKDAVNTAIQQRLKDHWDGSQPLNPQDLVNQFHLVPTPSSLTLLDKPGFQFSQHKSIFIKDDFSHDDQNRKILASYLKQDLDCQLMTNPSRFIIHLQKSETIQPEGYKLLIQNHKIIITASTHAGVFYALQTLRQLWIGNHSLPALVIEDTPRFHYRGIMLDVARHFFSVSEIKTFIDIMAAHKLNVLHLHLSDDEAWRLDLSTNRIDPLKSLTTVGSQRGFISHLKLPPADLIAAELDITNRDNCTLQGRLLEHHYTKANERYSGYYSLRDIHHLITYANARQITIIPEIDLPAHARALIHSLPKVFQNPQDKSRYMTIQGHGDDTLPVCLYNATSRQGKALTTTLDALLYRIHRYFAHQTTLFAQNEISLGGDEVAALAWNNDPSCQGPWANLSALDKEQLFFSNLSHHHPKLLISGWQQLVQKANGEIGHESPHPQQVGHLWVWEKSGSDKKNQGIKSAATLINSSYKTVLVFADDTYFDLTYTAAADEPGFRWAGAYLDTFAALRSAWHAQQTESLSDPTHHNNLLGIEAALWSENIPNFNHLAYMALPKMAGLAEASWAKAEVTTHKDGKLNWQSLAYRLGWDNHGYLGYIHHISHVKYRGYPHGISLEAPQQLSEPH